MRNATSIRRLATAVLVVLVAASCGDDTTATAPPSSTTPGTTTTAVPSGGWIGADEGYDWSGGGGDEGGRMASEEVASTRTDDASGGPVETPLPVPIEPGPPTSVPGGDPDPPLDTSLTAGSVDDNEAWEDYLLYRQDAQAAGFEYSAVDVSGRRLVSVTNADGVPVLGATVVIADGDGNEVWRSTTHADGRTLFLEPVGSGDGQQQQPTYSATVSRDGIESVTELASGVLVHELVLDVDQPSPVALDVLFLIDATGSMSDEIERLKANMVSVAEQIDALPGDADARYAMTVYRDQGDLFVTRTFDFTPDVDQFTEALREVVADGGGDEPEDLNAGLHEALEAPAWRDGPAAQLVFLVADAPPHLDYGGPDYAADALTAAGRGVKIFPIASSGLAPQGEYVFRQLAQLTMGRFVFLTYGADGAATGTERPDLAVDDYSVLALDELVVRIVSDELAPQQSVGG